MRRWRCSAGWTGPPSPGRCDEIRPLLAARGFAVPGKPGLRLKPLADVFAYAAAGGCGCGLTAPRCRSAAPRRPAGRRAFVSGKKKQNTIKATVDQRWGGRMLWDGAFRPARMHDATAVRTEGIEDLLRHYPDVQAEVDSGYQGLARDFPGQVSAPPKKPGKNAPPEQTARWEQQRHQQSSPRICVEHAIAEPKQWRPLQRRTGRREYFQETALAIARLVSDRAATR